LTSNRPSAQDMKEATILLNCALIGHEEHTFVSAIGHIENSELLIWLSKCVDCNRVISVAPMSKEDYDLATKGFFDD
jgi:hypothetical protein